MPARTHGKSHGKAHWKRPRSYKKWMNMRHRARHPERPGNACYADIPVDLSWGYEAFVAEMGEPKKGQVLDRIDNDKGYVPGNCRWTDKLTSARNKRWRVSPKGVAYARRMIGKMSQQEIAKVLGCCQKTVSNIIHGLHGY